jgi:hypothetical protein
LPKEGNKLMKEIRYIFRAYAKAGNQIETNPVLRDLLYRPYWRPRDSSPCLLPGVALISDGKYCLNWVLRFLTVYVLHSITDQLFFFHLSMRKNSPLSSYCSVDCLCTP